MDTLPFFTSKSLYPLSPVIGIAFGILSSLFLLMDTFLVGTFSFIIKGISSGISHTTAFILSKLLTGAIALSSFSKHMSFSRTKLPEYEVSLTSAPTSTEYPPFSSTHAVPKPNAPASSNDAKSRAALTRLTTCFSPGLRSFVFVNAVSTFEGFPILPMGAETNCITTSFPSNLPLFITSTVWEILTPSEVISTFISSGSIANSVYESP